MVDPAEARSGRLRKKTPAVYTCRKAGPNEKKSIEAKVVVAYVRYENFRATTGLNQGRFLPSCLFFREEPAVLWV